MKFFGVNKLVTRRGRIRMIRVMRGYRRLKVLGELGRVAAVKEELTITPVCTTFTPMHFMGLESTQAELAVRQFLLTRRVANGLGEALLESVGNHNSPVVYALPMKWRDVLRSHGFPVSERASMLRWAGFCCMYFAHGLLTIHKLAFANIIAWLRVKKSLVSHYIYFDDLSVTNLPAAGDCGGEHDVINWYLGWEQRASEIEQVCHGVANADMRLTGNTPVLSIKSPLVPLDTWDSLWQFLQWSVVSVLSVLRDLMRGVWWPALMLGEATKAAQVRYQRRQLLAHDYLFHNSNWIYRPLWTYEVERKGSRIIFYFYSTNCEKFKHKDANDTLAYGWQAMTWPQYLVWDEYQLNFIRRAVGPAAHINVVGPIPFVSGTKIPQDLPEQFIAVFDVQPMRDAIYPRFGIEFEYYVPRNAIRFLNDIQLATLNVGEIMVLKRKRDVGGKIHPSYEMAIDNLDKAANYTEIHPDISATEVIKKCKAVISAPFTSTALIGRKLGKPTAYYDPYAVLYKDDPASHGIPILQGAQELQDWLMNSIRPGQE